ncbi:MAG: hypothetical protein M1133_10455 [Armatimonadetes bacterium]|nr:hypothetical protein [Armatimonadota bacterium]
MVIPNESYSPTSRNLDLHCKLPGVSKPEAEDIVRQAHEKICPYSKARRGNVDVRLVVE